MEQRRATLWCKVLGQFVAVGLARAYRTQPTPPLVPEGWTVSVCLNRDACCYGTGCPFTTDGGECPFGAVGDAPDLPPERLDRRTEPSFEGEWE